MLGDGNMVCTEPQCVYAGRRQVGIYCTNALYAKPPPDYTRTNPLFMMWHQEPSWAQINPAFVSISYTSV